MAKVVVNKQGIARAVFLRLVPPLDLINVALILVLRQIVVDSVVQDLVPMVHRHLKFVVLQVILVVTLVVDHHIVVLLLYSEMGVIILGYAVVKMVVGMMIMTITVAARQIATHFLVAGLVVFDNSVLTWYSCSVMKKLMIHTYVPCHMFSLKWRKLAGKVCLDH